METMLRKEGMIKSRSKERAINMLRMLGAKQHIAAFLTTIKPTFV